MENESWVTNYRCDFLKLVVVLEPELANFYFNEIELDCECDTDPKFCDSISIFESMLTSVSLPMLDLFSEPTLIHVSIDFEIEPPLLDSHISLMGKECEIKFFDLNSTNRLSNPKLIFSS